MGWTSYAIGLGSNRPHGRHGNPRNVLAAAVGALESAGCRIVAVAPVIETAPLGPTGRRFANGAVLLDTRLEPLPLLRLLKRLERGFGRRPGRRWGMRVLDLDILLWSEGRFVRRGLLIPHRELARRRFVLAPLSVIAGDWRVPPTGLRIRHLAARRARLG